MASKKPQYQIPAPSTGVRKDVDPMLIDQTMAADGANCLYFDGALRPRPALTTEVSEVLGFENYQLLLDGHVVFDDSVNRAVYAMASADDESWILLPTANATWIYSRDKGSSWEEASLSWPGAAGSFIRDMCVCGGYLYAVVQTLTEWDIYSTPIATILDGGMSWTKQNASAITGSGRQFFHLTYYSYYDAFIMSASYSEFGSPYTLQYKPFVWAFVDASTGSPTEQVLGLDDSEIGVSGYVVDSPAIWAQEKYLIYGVKRIPKTWEITPETDTYGSYIWADSLEFNSGTGLFELTRASDTIEVWYSSVEDNGVVRNPLEIPLVETAPINAARAYGFVDARVNDEILFMVGNKLTTEEEGQFIGVVKHNDTPEFDGRTLAKRVSIPYDGQSRTPVAGRRTEEKIVFFFNIRYKSLPELYVSADNGQEFMKISGPDEDYSVGGQTLSSGISYFNDESDQHYWWANFDADLDFKSNPVLYLMPSSSGSSQYGSFTNMVELDLDDEEDAIVVGTTNALLRLDKDNSQWQRITANQTEFIDGSDIDPPGGPYTPDGVYTSAEDIPPLSVAAGDPEYVSGLTIDSVYGQNPWVFRSFEANGKTFLLATNGQCYPLVYNSEMNGGFARRMGEVPTTNDPNYRVMSTWETDNEWLANGNLAPRARCMAVAANRVILANNPTGSPFEVNVGGFNDMDRGWGTPNSQLVLLGDTAGQIVTMEEISALQVAIYKEDAIYHAIAQTEFLGVSAPFRFELAKAGISGPCSPASVLRNFDGRQIYLARDGGVYMYDGVAPLDGGRNIRRMIQNDIDLNNLGKCWGMVDHQRKLVWFFYPGRNQQVNKGIVISTDQGYPWPTWPVELPDGWNFTCGAEINLSEDASLRDLREFGTYNEETLSSFSSGQVAMLTGRETGVFFSQKWEDDGDYSDSGLPIKCRMKGGWLTPGGLQIHTADELYHIFSSPDPDQEIRVRLRAQKIGSNIVSSPWRTLTAGKPRRRTRHRVGGMQFGVDLKADVSRSFSWGGAILTASNGGRNRG